MNRSIQFVSSLLVLIISFGCGLEPQKAIDRPAAPTDSFGGNGGPGGNGGNAGSISMFVQGQSFQPAQLEARAASGGSGGAAGRGFTRNGAPGKPGESGQPGHIDMRPSVPPLRLNFAELHQAENLHIPSGKAQRLAPGSYTFSHVQINGTLIAEGDLHITCAEFLVYKDGQLRLDGQEKHPNGYHLVVETEVFYFDGVISACGMTPNEPGSNGGNGGTIQIETNAIWSQKGSVFANGANGQSGKAGEDADDIR